MSVTLDRPWLRFDLGREMQVLSWAPHRAGLVTADRILWREVRNSDLTPDLDVTDWLTAQLAAVGQSDAVTFLTSRDVSAYEVAEAEVEGIRAMAVATVGLSNAERVGHRMDYTGRDWGTINVALRLSCGLTQAALIEALSIATQARTAAVIEAGMRLPTGRATGTGTDCIAVAAPSGAEAYCGLHTAAGEATGRAVYDAVLTGALAWLEYWAIRAPGIIERS
ncbi:adenosylcobinamide amidohydrolase [Pseudooceanicola nanhaiensis]|uniref:adenosylcobinamide amidohydrolase n=1 Tax=Pseudooceanicola nanhaiensis TaxID=375761 RepID=UPI001CD40135|nr:adenosylcobinamide amidohydrolase [Pseudooceanicola nanhaiensis]MCA0921876.1 adenosylcobinamide amidohydrolase [Pseudooceanicola nanhaiensis]